MTTPTSKPILRRLVVLPLAALVLAIGLQLVPKLDEPYFAPPQPMAKLLPENEDGWVGEDTPLGETEFMEQVVKDVLRYDEAFFRVYRKGDTQVGVYAAYWGPGSINPIDAATHSPDLCWVNAGWREEKHTYDLTVPDGRGGDLLETQYRVFVADGGQRQEVLFWHLLGGRVSGYAMGPSTRWRERLPVMIDNQVHNQFGRIQREQVFLRISTNKTIEELLSDPFWGKLTKALGPMGIESSPSDDSINPKRKNPS